MAHEWSPVITYRPVSKGQVVYLGDDTSHKIIGKGMHLLH